MTFSLSAIFLAGLLTLVTPCILPMLPVYFALLLGEGVDAVKSGNHRFRLLTTTAWFVLGFGLVFVALGLAASAVGSALTEYRSQLLGVSGAVIAVFGAKQLGWVRIPWLDRTFQLKAVESRYRWLSGLAFGVAFALGWTPCVGPILGAVLTFAAASSTTPWQGALMLAFYAAGVGFPLLVISLAAERLLPFARSLQRALPKIEKFTGTAMLAVGVLLMATPAWSFATTLMGDDAARGSSSAQDDALGKPSERPRLVEFYSKNCPTCAEMAPLLEQLRQDCQDQDVDVVLVDVSDPKHQSVAADFGVRAVPAFHLFEASGQTATTVYGGQTLPELRAMASQLIDAPCAGISSKDQTPSPAPTSGCSLRAADASSADGNAAELFECGQDS